MDVIGNNIANVNTVGYKSSRVTFQEMLSQVIQGASAPTANKGGTNPQQVGLGVSVGTIDVMHSQGNPQYTGNINDLAVEGEGFFVLSDGQQTVYTRAGTFGLDSKVKLDDGTEVASGNFVSLVNGMRLMGYQADRLGNIDNNSQIQPLYISTSDTLNPVATTDIVFTGNLDNRYDGTETVSRSAVVYDSLGRKHTVIVDLTRNTDAGAPTNEWGWNGRRMLLPSEQTTVAVPPADEVPFTHNGRYSILNAGDVGYGTYAQAIVSGGSVIAVSDDGTTWHNVDEDGVVLDDVSDTPFTTTTALSTGYEYVSEASQDGSTITLTQAAQYLQGGNIAFNSNGSFQGVDSQTISFNPPLSEAMSISLDFSNFTHYEEEFSGKFAGQNGFSSGTLESYAIDQNGMIIGSFSNGLTKALGQLALAKFANAGGLQRVGSTMFSETSNSGSAQIAAVGSSGYGSITPSSLEMSNVDLSQEFTDMIVTQRGFQANSRIITSSDEMLQELVNLKR